MKKIFTIIFALFFILNANRAFSVENIVSLDEVEQNSQEQVIENNENMTTPLEVEVVFDWLDLSQAKRDENINPTKWWNEFPDYLKKYYFMFVSGTYKGEIADKLNKIYLETNVFGTAMPIVKALLVADKIKSNEMNLQDFERGIYNTEYTILH